VVLTGNIKKSAFWCKSKCA